MSDIDGAAAPAEGAPASESAVQIPNPVATEAEGHPETEKTDTKPVKSDVPEKSPTAREALQRAAEKVEKDNKEPAKAETRPEKAEAKTEPKKDEKDAKTEPVRDETGKFAAKDGDRVKVDAPKAETKPSYTAGDPPARFTADAKAVWATLPENVRGEVSRMERELTQGYEKHKAAAERDASLAEFHEMAKNGGTTVKEALSRYVGMENQLRANPLKGLEIICQNAGLSLRDVAAHVLGQTPDQTASAQDATIRELKQTIASLEQKVGSVAQTFQHQQQTATAKEVEAFAAQNPRFDELAEDIAFFLKSGRTNDLSEAYKLAERLNPAPKATTEQPAASSAPAIDLSVQTDKGSKSIKGAPTPGSNPAAKQPSSSIKESLRRAMAAAG